MDVMFYEVFAEEEAALRRYLPATVTAGFSRQTIQMEPGTAPPAAVISMRTQSVIPAPWIDQLQGILTRSTEFDHLQAVRRQSNGRLPCGYLPDYCARAVAEHAFLAMMALARRLKSQLRAFTTFTRDGLTGWECAGRTLLIVGVGRIGTQVIDGNLSHLQARHHRIGGGHRVPSFTSWSAHRGRPSGEKVETGVLHSLQEDSFACEG